MQAKSIHSLFEAMGIDLPTQSQIKAAQRLLKQPFSGHRFAKESVLTTTHRTYLRWVMQGYDVEEIAQVMAIKTSTVYEHRGDIKKRMNCNTMEQAIIKAFELGYLTLPNEMEQRLNMLSIDLLEQNGWYKPTQKQIDKVEAALWQLHWSHEGTSKHANHFNHFTQNTIHSLQISQSVL